MRGRPGHVSTFASTWSKTRTCALGSMPRRRPRGEPIRFAASTSRLRCRVYFAPAVTAVSKSMNGDKTKFDDVEARSAVKAVLDERVRKIPKGRP